VATSGSDATKAVRQIQAAKNQSLFREVNERVDKLDREIFASTTPLSFVCECWDVECAQQIELTHEEYELVRSQPVWFVVAPGHELLEVEETVSSGSRFAIVEKVEDAVPVAISLNPRR
jgi:hypothetical protein